MRPGGLRPPTTGDGGGPPRPPMPRGPGCALSSLLGLAREETGTASRVNPEKRKGDGVAVAVAQLIRRQLLLLCTPPRPRSCPAVAAVEDRRRDRRREERHGRLLYPPSRSRYRASHRDHGGQRLRQIDRGGDGRRRAGLQLRRG